MSRCKACNKKLNDIEMTRKLKCKITGKIEYTEMCTQCLRGSDYQDFIILANKTNPILEIEEEYYT